MDVTTGRILVAGSTVALAGALTAGVLVGFSDSEIQKVPVPGPTVTQTDRFPVKIPVPGPTVTKKVTVEVTKTVRPKYPPRATRSNERKVPRKQSSSRSYGSAQAAAKAIFGSQYSCAASLISRESGWNVHATNPSSGAYGLGQALPPSKMASAGSDWRTNPSTQLRWMKSYVDSRYGGACSAWSFWTSHHYY